MQKIKSSYPFGAPTSFAKCLAWFIVIEYSEILLCHVLAHYHRKSALLKCLDRSELIIKVHNLPNCWYLEMATRARNMGMFRTYSKLRPNSNIHTEHFPPKTHSTEYPSNIDSAREFAFPNIGGWRKVVDFYELWAVKAFEECFSDHFR